MNDVPSGARISPEEAYRKMTSEGYVYVDVRTEAEFDEGHPAGAYNVPILVAGDAGLVENPDFLRVMTSHFARDAKVIVGCKAGQRSMRAVRVLLSAGYTHLFDQRAGFGGVTTPFGQVKEKGWKALGLPAEEGAPPERAYSTLAPLMPN